MSASSSKNAIASAVAFYWVISISLVFLNKLLLSGSSSVSVPFFITAVQCAVTVVICYAASWLAHYGARVPALAGVSRTIAEWDFPAPTLDLRVAKQVMPLSAAFVGMVALNNLTLKLVPVSFYLVARSLTIVFNVIVSRLVLGEVVSKQVLMCLAVVIAGFLIGADGEPAYTAAGLLAGVGSSLFVSLNSIFTKSTLPAVAGNKWSLALYNNINACVLFIPIVLMTGELDVLVASEGAYTAFFWTAALLSGVFGFLIGIATILQIQRTSPLTHNISGTAKSGAQTALGYVVEKNPVAPGAVLGVLAVLGGSLAYAIVRLREMQPAHASPPTERKGVDMAVAEHDDEEAQVLRVTERSSLVRA